MPSSKNINSVAVLTEKFQKAKAVYFTDYVGLDVATITKLRSQFFKAEIEYTVAKNTLIKVAAERNNILGLDQILTGPTAVAISYHEPTSPAKVLKAFTKEHEKPTVKGILFDRKIMEGSEFKRLADLPSKTELLAKLMAMLQSPLVKLVNTINAPMMNLAYALNNLKKQKS